MGAVIITTRSLLWVILTLISTVLVLTAVLAPKWVIGATRNSGTGRYQDSSVSFGGRGSGYSPYQTGNSQYGYPPGNQFGDRSIGYDRSTGYNGGYNGGYRSDRDRYGDHYNSVYGDYYVDDKPSVGLFNRCTYIDGRYNCANLWSEGFSDSANLFPTSWKMSMFFFIVGLGLMCLTIAMAFMSCCVQSCFNKSVFTVAGSIQTIAGFLFLLGLVIYMFGWGAKRVERLCGRDSGSFMTGDCSLGWAFYTALFGIILTFITACLSVAAEKATSSDQTSSTPKPY